MDILKKILETKKVAQDKDIKDREGTQPSKYFSGVSKKSKAARDAHFKKGAKMDDDNPKAYKPAPGDAKAKTKPSQHTKKFQKMFGENYDGDMALNSLENIIRNANALKRVVSKQEDYPAWWNSKLTKSDDYLDVCHDYLMSELSQGRVSEDNLPDLEEAVDIKKALKKVKGLTKKQLETLQSIPNPQLTVIAQQLSSLMMGDEVDESLWANIHNKRKRGEKMRKPGEKGAPKPGDFERARGEEIEERLADKLRQKEKDNQQAHQKRMMKLAKQSIKKNRKEDVEEDRDYKKEYENYHSKPEQVKRRQKRNEARRSLKDNKDIKGKDVHHKDNNPMNNDKSNLSIVSQNFNRKEPRMRNESTKEYGKSLRKMALDKQLKKISKKDKATLLKIADLLAKEK